MKTGLSTFHVVLNSQFVCPFGYKTCALNSCKDFVFSQNKIGIALYIFNEANHFNGLNGFYVRNFK